MSLHVSIVLPHQVNIAGMENARQGLMEANSFLEGEGSNLVFDIEVVSCFPKVLAGNGNIEIKAEKQIDNVSKTDLIIIPPIQGDFKEALMKNAALYPWICQQYKKGAHVASLCLGAFILAQTGLLDYKKCVTHWRANEVFKQLFPKVKLLPEKIITEQERLFTGGGAFSSANLVLYIIEKFAGKEAAHYCTNIFQIDAQRSSQMPFIIFNNQKDHGDSAILGVQEYIENHYPEKLTIANLSNKAKLGRRTFERRFKAATYNTPLEYIQRIRVEAVKKKLEKEYKTIQEVMFEVGYNDAKSFRDLFKKYTGMTPFDYKAKFNSLSQNK